MKTLFLSKILGLAGIGAVAALATGCAALESEDPAKVTLRAEFNVTSDPGHPVQGVALLSGGRTLGTTDASGHGALTMTGQEGDRVEVLFQCPSGYDSPAKPVVVALRHLSSERPPQFNARCAPTTRTVVVGIRADNGPDLPVMYLGREVARTDASGAANVILSVRPNDQVSLALDTQGRDPKAPHLRPESPVVTFRAQDKDDVVALDQHFDVDRVVQKRARPTTGPRRL